VNAELWGRRTCQLSDQTGMLEGMDGQDHESVDVFIGVDVGKTNHHAVALDSKRRRKPTAGRFP
jgi:hypothetical protein